MRATESLPEPRTGNSKERSFLPQKGPTLWTMKLTTRSMWARSERIGQSVGMTAPPNASPVHFEGSVANIGRDWSMTITTAPPGPPRRIDGYTIGAIPNIDGPGPHGGEVHPDGDEFLYVVSGTMELILDDGNERAAGVETKVLLRPGDAYVVPRGVWHRLESVEPSYSCHAGPEWRPSTA